MEHPRPPRARSWWELALAVLLFVGVPTGVVADESSDGLRAGAATTDITVPLGTTTRGVIGRGGPAVHVHDALRAHSLVLDDGETRLAVVMCDLRMIGRDIVDHAKQLIERRLELPPDHVLIAATHTHAAPPPGVIAIHTSEETDRAYTEFLAQRIADAVQLAVNNLAPARVGWGSAQVPQHLFNRRWFMKKGAMPANPFGQTTDKVKMNPPRGSPDLVKPAGPVDPELFVVSVQHTDGRPLALLANYGLHYVGGYEPDHISADYFGIFADRIRDLLEDGHQDPPFVAMLSNGTSGDVNNINFREAGTTLPPWVKMRQVAYDLADEAIRIYEEIEYQDRVTLAAVATELELGVRKPDENRLEWAQRTLGAVKSSERPSRPQIYAGEAMRLARFPDEVLLKLAAFRIGDLGIVAIPCEVFAETGLQIKKASPLRPVFTIELANGYNGYLPTPEQHRLGGYETWPARSSYLEVDAEPEIRGSVGKLLQQLSDGKQTERQ